MFSFLLLIHDLLSRLCRYFYAIFVLILFVSVHVNIDVIVVNIMLFISMLSSRWFLSLFVIGHVIILNVYVTYAYLCLSCEYLYYDSAFIFNCYLLIYFV